MLLCRCLCMLRQPACHAHMTGSLGREKSNPDRSHWAAFVGCHFEVIPVSSTLADWPSSDPRRTCCVSASFCYYSSAHAIATCPNGGVRSLLVGGGSTAPLCVLLRIQLLRRSVSSCGVLGKHLWQYPTCIGASAKCNVCCSHTQHGCLKKICAHVAAVGPSP